MKINLDILDEPRSVTYTALLRFAATKCDRFSLVWRKQLKFNPSAQEVTTALSPWLISEAETNSWPGTQMFGQGALVRQYSITRQSVEILKIAKGLYAWLSPDLPEDLAFYLPGGKPWLATVGHEHMAWFEDETLLSEEVLKHVPAIKLSR